MPAACTTGNFFWEKRRKKQGKTFTRSPPKGKLFFIGEEKRKGEAGKRSDL